MKKLFFNQGARLEKNNQNLKEFIFFVMATLLIVLPIRIFIAQPFIVSGASMIPSFTNGEYIIVDQISYKTLQSPQRGDIVIFKSPQDPSKFLIKRVIGLPNETIEILGEDIYIKKEGEDFEKIEEDYLNVDFNAYVKNLKLENDEFFVLGDNRNNSIDSRYFGAVKENLIIGRAFLRLLPIRKINYLPGKFEI